MNTQLREQLIDELARSADYLDKLQQTGKPSFYAQKAHNLLQACLSELDENDKLIDRYRTALDKLRNELNTTKTDLFILRHYLIEKYSDDLYEFDGQLAKKYGKLPDALWKRHNLTPSVKQ